MTGRLFRVALAGAYLCLASLPALAAEAKKEEPKPEQAAPAAPASDAAPVAKIGDAEVVTRQDWDRAVAAVEQRIMVTMRQQKADPAKPGAPQMTDEQRMNLLNTLVNNRIVLMLAKESGIQVSDEDAKAELDKRKAELPSGTNFADFLQQRGLSEKDALDKTRQQLMMSRFEDAKSKDLTVTDQEIKDNYEKAKERGVLDEVDVQHILIKAVHTDKAAIDKAKASIDAAYQRLKKGEDFAAVAKEVSEDPGSKDKGGEYKGVHRGQMVPEFDKRMAEGKIGEITEPFQTQFGWHILKVTRHDVIPLDAAISEKIKGDLLMRKKKLEVKRLVDEARAKLSITINLPPTAAPAAPGQPAAPAGALLDAAS